MPPRSRRPRSTALRGESLVALQQQVDDPVAAASTVVSRELYGPGHPYGHTIAEVAAALTATTREDLQRFHQSAFTPRTSALILSGDLTADQARALATEHFGSWSGTGTDPPPPGPPSPASERVFVVDLPGSPQTTLALAQPGISVTDPDSTAMRVMNAVLGGGFTSRINRTCANATDTPTAHPQASTLGRDVGLLTLQTNVSTESTAASIRELLNEVAAMRDAPVGAEELARAKDSLSLSLPADFATGTSTAAGRRPAVPGEPATRLLPEPARSDRPDRRRRRPGGSASTPATRGDESGRGRRSGADRPPAHH